MQENVSDHWSTYFGVTTISASANMKPLESISREAVLAIGREQAFDECLYPGCRDHSIRSHTFQRNGVLKMLSDDSPGGKVVIGLDGNSTKGKGEWMSEIPISTASTFNGFCSPHDRSIFLPIEQRDFDTRDKRVQFLFAYRVFMRTYCDLISLKRTCEGILEHTPNDAKLIKEIDSRKVEIAEANSLFDYLNEALAAENWDAIYTNVVPIRSPVRFVAGGMAYVERNTDGSLLHSCTLDRNGSVRTKERKLKYRGSLNNGEPPLLVSVMPTSNTQGCILLSCARHERAIKQYRPLMRKIGSLSQNRLREYFNIFLPAHLDQIYLAPQLWRSWNEEEKGDYLELLDLSSKQLGNVPDNIGRHILERHPFANTKFNMFASIEQC